MCLLGFFPFAVMRVTSLVKTIATGKGRRDNNRFYSNECGA